MRQRACRRRCWGGIIAKGKFIFPVFQTGGLGLRNRKKELQVEDWERIKKEIDKIL